MILPKQDKISWRQHEHRHTNKTTDWYWTVGLIAIGGIFLSLFFGNYLFALIILLFVVISFMLVRREPQIITFEISRKGVRTGNILHPYSLLESFWVEDTEFDDQILFKSKKPLSPIIILPFDSMVTNPEEIRDFLLDYLNEEELEEPLYQILMEWFGF